MPEMMTIVLVLVGLALLFVGATFSSYAVGLLGLVIGGSGGYLLGPALAGALGFEAILVVAAATIIGALVGALLTAMLLKGAVAAIAFIVGTYAGWAAIAGLIVGESSLLEIPVAIGVGVVAAAIAFLMTRTMLVVLTSFVGAALASRAVSWADVVEAQELFHPEPLLFDVSGVLFLGLFVLGILSQLGLFKLGYTAKLLHIIPGIRPIRNRGEG